MSACLVNSKALYSVTKSKPHMTNTSVTFSLELGSYDSLDEADAGKDVTFLTPQINVYFSANHAAADKEGINIWEGDLWFFASDGLPLEASFSKKPYVDMVKNEYFRGVYTLQPGHGESLQDAIAKIVGQNDSPHSQIIVRMPDTNEGARVYGWSDIESMTAGIENALEFLPLDMARRIVFEYPF